jgi:hypothetical protein
MLSLTKYKTEEVKFSYIDDAYPILASYLNNPVFDSLIIYHTYWKLIQLLNLIKRVGSLLSKHQHLKKRMM